MSFTPEIPVSCTQEVPNVLEPGKPNRTSSWSLFTCHIQGLEKTGLRSSKQASSYEKKSTSTPTSTPFTRFRIWKAVDARSGWLQPSLKNFVTTPSSPQASPRVASSSFSSPTALSAPDARFVSQTSQCTTLNGARKHCPSNEVFLPLVLKSNRLGRLSAQIGNDVHAGELQRENHGCKVISPQISQSSSSHSSDKRGLYYGSTSPLVSWVRKKRLNHVRRKISLKLRRLWRITSRHENRYIFPWKRRLQFHNSHLCKAYAYMPGAVEKDISDVFDLGACLESLIQDCGDNWYDTWRPSLFRFWKGAQFWTVEVGSYILLAPVLIPWEVCAIIGILVNHIWTIGRDISADKVLFKLRNHMEWIARGEVVGILLGFCMSFAHRRR